MIREVRREERREEVEQGREMKEELPAWEKNIQNRIRKERELPEQGTIQKGKMKVLLNLGEQGCQEWADCS